MYVGFFIIIGSLIPPWFHSPPLPTLHPLFSPSYRFSPVLSHPILDFWIHLSIPRVLPSLVQLVGVYHHSPLPYFITHPSTVVAPIGHPAPPPFQFVPSTEVFVVDVSLEHVVRLSTPPSNESMLLPQLFIVR
jgi:hypothetical protein